MYVHEYKKLRLNYMKGQLVKILNHVNSQMHRRFLFFILKINTIIKLKELQKILH